MATKDVQNADGDSGLTQEQIDYLTIMNDVPVARLNADMYAAEDIDGATEGLTGSGNLNYLVLQSSQTNEARQVNDPFATDTDGSDLGGVSGAGAGGIAALAGSDGGDLLSRAVDGDGSMGDLDAGPVMFDGQGTDAGGIGGGGGGGIAPISALSYNSATSNTLNQLYEGDEFNEVNNPPGGPGTPGGPGRPGDPGGNGSGNNGNDGNSGNDGRDGGPGPAGPPGPGPEDLPGPDGDDVDLTLDLDTGILDSDYDINLDLIEEILGDLDIDIDGVINDILNGGILGGSGLGIDLDHLGNGLLDLDSDNLIGTTVTELENLTNQLVDMLPDEITGLLTNPLGSVADLLGFNADGDTDLVVNLVPNLPVDIAMLDTLGLHVPLDPVEEILGDIDINIDTVLADLLNGNILEDTDLLLTAFHNQNDILTLASDDVLAPALDLLDGVTGGMLDSVLNGPGDGDTDLSVGILSDLGFFGGGTSDIHVPLDAVETLIGDIDIDIDNLLSLETILDADGLTNGDLPGLESTIDVATDILPGFETDIALDDLSGSVEDLLGGLEGLAGDVDVADTLAALQENLQDGLAMDGALLDDFLTDVADAPGGDIFTDITGDVVAQAGDDIGDAVEALFGDSGDIAAPLEDILGDIGGGGGEEPGDEDLTLDTGFSVLGIDMDDVDLDVPLDPVEALVGDIDVDIDAAAIIEEAAEGDILDAVGAALAVEADIDLVEDITDLESIGLFADIGDADEHDDEGLDWPEASITDVVDDVTGGLLSGGGEILDLPDPVGVLTDGLGGVIDDTPLSTGGGGLLGGLFG